MSTCPVAPNPGPESNFADSTVARSYLDEFLHRSGSGEAKLVENPSKIPHFSHSVDNADAEPMKDAAVEGDTRQILEQKPDNASNSALVGQETDDKAKLDREGVYDVEKIVGRMRTRAGVVKYNVKWEGFGHECNTWEPESHLNCDRLIKEYIEEHGEIDVPDSEPVPTPRRGRKPASRKRVPKKQTATRSACVEAVSKRSRNSSDAEGPSPQKQIKPSSFAKANGDESDPTTDESSGEEEVQRVSSDDNIGTEYEVEKIIGYREDGDKEFYLLKWKGYEEDKADWVEKLQLNCENLVNEYWAKVQANRNQVKNRKNNPTPGQSRSKSRGKREPTTKKASTTKTKSSTSSRAIKEGVTATTSRQPVLAASVPDAAATGVRRSVRGSAERGNQSGRGNSRSPTAVQGDLPSQQAVAVPADPRPGRRGRSVNTSNVENVEVTDEGVARSRGRKGTSDVGEMSSLGTATENAAAGAPAGMDPKRASQVFIRDGFKYYAVKFENAAGQSVVREMKSVDVRGLCPELAMDLLEDIVDAECLSKVSTLHSPHYQR